MASRTISTKLAVDGEAGFREAIRNCNSELSTLKSSLALTESQFKDNANSMAALTSKGDVLKESYTAQTKKIAELEEALSGAKTAQQAYSDRVATAEEKVNEYKAALAALENSTEDREIASAEGKTDGHLLLPPVQQLRAGLE